MKQIISIFLCSQLIFYSIAYAEPKSIFVKEGDKSPFSGLLLNDEAQAKIIAEKQEKEKLCDLEKKYLKMRSELDCKRDTDNLKIDLISERKKYDEILKIKDNEINQLQKIASKNPNSHAGWWIALGSFGGVVLTVSMFLIVSQVKKVD